MMIPCGTCDYLYGPVDASDKVKLRFCHRTLTKARIHLQAAISILETLEWSGEDSGYAACPVCDGIAPALEMRKSGHDPLCLLAKTLREGGGLVKETVGDK
jgi:hypothetical protein